MPVYLLHGFRWPRPLIRIHIILQNLDDAAAEWIVAPGTSKTMLENFRHLYPQAMARLKRLRFVEQYDPDDLSLGAASQPYAYVADICEEVKLGIDIDEFRAKGVASDQLAALTELRDKLAPEAKLGWFVVVCGDEERLAALEADDEVEEGRPSTAIQGDGEISQADSGTIGSYTSNHKLSLETKDTPKEDEREPRGFKKFFGLRRKSRSRANPSGGPLPTVLQPSHPLPMSPMRSPISPPLRSPTFPPRSAVSRKSPQLSIRPA